MFDVFDYTNYPLQNFVPLSSNRIGSVVKIKVFNQNLPKNLLIESLACVGGPDAAALWLIGGTFE